MGNNLLGTQNSNHNKAPIVRVADGKVVPAGDGLGARQEFTQAAMSAIGTQSFELAGMIIEQLIRSHGTASSAKEIMINGALAALHEYAPENANEALLVSQMIACHARYMDFMARAARTGDPDRQDKYLNTAMKLSRVFVAQTTALQKMHQKGRQKMTVEHVHVHNGGQAIVGNMTQGKGEQGE